MYPWQQNSFYSNLQEGFVMVANLLDVNVVLALNILLCGRIGLGQRYHTCDVLKLVVSLYLYLKR